jgi:hypothetical protein
MPKNPIGNQLSSGRPSEHQLPMGICCVFLGPSKGRLHNFPGPLFLVIYMRHQFSLYSPFPPLFLKSECYINIATHQPTLLTLKMVAASIPRTSSTSPTTTGCENPRAEVISIINYRESLKSVIITAVVYCLSY